jgi:hypothetical protein
MIGRWISVGGCGLGRRCDASGVLGERLPGCEVGWLLRSVEVGSGSAADRQRQRAVAAGGCQVAEIRRQLLAARIFFWRIY